LSHWFRYSVLGNGGNLFDWTLASGQDLHTWVALAVLLGPSAAKCSVTRREAICAMPTGARAINRPRMAGSALSSVSERGRPLRPADGATGARRERQRAEEGKSWSVRWSRSAR
jgi:hypothetical protein